MGALNRQSTVPQSMPTPPQAQAPARKSGFAAAKPRGTRSVLSPINDHTAGVYTVKVNRLQRIMRHESKSPQPCESAIIELEVVTSNVPECPPGYQASATFTDRYFVELYYSDVKGFMCALLNAEPEEIDESDLDGVFGDQADEFVGYKVNVTVKYKLREGKHPITLYAWTPNKEQHPTA